MAEDHAKGAGNKVKGAIKEAVGKATDDKSLQNEGRGDRAKGHAQTIVGDVKDAARDLTRK